ncbi:ribonucleotide-diphosphate reductase subunit beta [Pseudoblastomonas halimionae]|uniref:Ribonucleoside-diphosphate reductase subunit beta n=1 Tax=Alteriqipengyuania halimionae TaxID=1926630 RepID=A0A6I4U4S8_9SPHN|nr:ribonucleotide-diphosphate reductase subunit beta [Alteriqipengyuania halimionae]MXP11119.1 ribonucleotide-diphosphate reductase subunit beta [Alteriqipengyuania halimionae]
MSLLEARKTYKPFEYPWAYDFWKRQQQVHWMPEEVPLGEDCRDWAQKLSDHERNLLTQIFRFFTQADVEVQDCYHEKYGRVFKPTEVKMMLASFSNMETIHIAAYSHLLDTIGMPESEYGMFLEYEEMKDKHDYLQEFGVDNDEDIARTLAMFGGFTEGLQLFASFAMLMNFPRFNKMKGMGQIVSWSVRDESLHCEGITKLFHAFCKERDCLTKSVKEDIMDMCQKTVRLEDAFIDLAFEDGPVPGMTAKEIKKYIRYIADWRLSQLGLPSIYMVEDHPLPWLTPLLNGVEHANFFETRATEYSKGATRGDWQDVWSSFDKRKKAGAANEEGDAEDDGPGLFEDSGASESAGVAAE